MLAVLVTHSHWDREWYETFQGFRHRLIGLMEAVFGLIEAPDGLAGFLLDGQSCILEDVLEIRPDWESRLRSHVAAGRLWVGPWYTLPDEFLVSGEALIRNLARGIRTGSRFGAWMAVGYTPDSFGHQAQLPQLLRGFGIESAVFQRGLDEEPALLEWEAPDGSRVLVCYLRDSYNNAAWLPDEPDGFARELRRAIDSIAAHSPVAAVLLMNGNDHLYPNPNLPERLREAAPRLPGVELRSGSLEDYIAEASSAVRRAGVDLHTVTGELRSGRRHPVLPGVLSTRMWLKQRNAAAQVLLERYAEPLCTLVGPRASGQRPFLDEAWRILMLNHFHDSICGTGVDAVQREMDVRFDQVEAIGRAVVESAAGAAGAGAVLPGSLMASDPTPSGVLVFNPVPGEATASPVRVRLRALPPGLTYRLFAAAGADVPLRLVAAPGLGAGSWEVPPAGWPGLLDGLERGTIGAGVVAGRAWYEPESCRLWVERGDRRPTEMAELAARLRRLAPPERPVRVRWQVGGSCELAFLPEPPAGVGSSWLRLDVVAGETARLEERALPGTAIESGHLRLEADPDEGTLRLVDRLTGRTFRRLNLVQDEGDAGDVYNHSPPAAGRVVDRPAELRIRAFEEPPLGRCLEVERDYDLPAGLTPDRSERSAELVRVSVVSRAWLRNGAPRLDIETRVTNRARDHRLRVHFPTPLQARNWYTANAFALIERGLEPEAHFPDADEAPIPTRPMDGFALVEEGGAGLLLAARGLPEVEALAGEDGSIAFALTLLRCTGWLSRADLPVRRGPAGPQLETPSAQCPGDWQFDYSLIPFGGDRWEAVQEAQRYLAPPVALASPGRPLRLKHLGVTPDRFVLTSLKPTDEGEELIARGCNASAEPVTAELDFGEGLEAAWEADLLERPLRDLVIEGGRVRILVPPARVATVRVRMSQV